VGRVGVVLGAGGVVGHAFHAGVLSALHRETGFEPATAELLIGTSAGSIVATMLRAGITAADLEAGIHGGRLTPRAQHLYSAARSRGWRPGRVPGQSGGGDGGGAPAASGTAGGGGGAGFRRSLVPGWESPRMLLEAVVRPWRASPGALLAGLLPRGRVPTTMITDWLAPVFAEGWPPAEPGRQLWICAVDLSNGHRVVFGRPGSPEAALSEAVAASCAIPGFFTPVTIGRHSYVDGGVHSGTNADLMAAEELDLVLVSAPMSASKPLSGGLDMAGRRLARVTLGREVAALRRRGTKVLVFQPTPEDRAIMGVNAMDPRRRQAVAHSARESTFRRLARPDVADRLALLA
jgi:NTE family protein